jgi:glycosyltransferase XagB
MLQIVRLRSNSIVRPRLLVGLIVMKPYQRLRPKLGGRGLPHGTSKTGLAKNGLTKNDAAKRVRRKSRDTRLRDPSPVKIAHAALKARTALYLSKPDQSAKIPRGRVFVAVLLAICVVAILSALQVDAFAGFWSGLWWLFAGLGLVRMLACLVVPPADAAINAEVEIEAAPMWTVLIALYKEADSVASLLAALDKLEWPRANLDIIFACESDDSQTLRALVDQRQTYEFRIVRVPPGGPRTKPNALQTALPFARGRFLTVYDAEDRPSPTQLRAAFHAFVTADQDLAVVQAPLVAWNHRESWIARQFALDYAIWFRVMLPALYRLSGLLPLGGTSNHFRTATLCDVGGWDPYNVTEDADLGVRLARGGYRAGLITPPTFGEAPPQCGAWVRQRGRWIQGHIQTFGLHLGTPLALAKGLGLRGCLAFVLGFGTGPLAALLTLPMIVGSLASLNTAALPSAGPFLIAGLAFNVVTSCVACQRDGRWSLLVCVPTLPFYCCLQSLASCRAIWRVVFTPTIWDKTDHGFAARVHLARGKATWTGQPLSSSYRPALPSSRSALGAPQGLQLLAKCA